MHPMTEENLKNAFAGESQAHMKYQIFSEKAEEEGFKNIARLFRAIAYAELVHAKNHLNALSAVSQTPENLERLVEEKSRQFVDEGAEIYHAK